METSEVTTKTKWSTDPAHSEIGFTVKHLMFTNVRGRFNEFDVQVHTRDNDFKSAEIEVRIKSSSVSTGIEQRDQHLRSADFFDVDMFDEITFRGNKFIAGDQEGNFELYGDLTMKGVKKEVKLNVEFGPLIKDPWGTEKALFIIDGKINRKDWGLNYNAALEAGGVLVGETVTIHCEAQLIKQA